MVVVGSGWQAESWERGLGSFVAAFLAALHVNVFFDNDHQRDRDDASALSDPPPFCTPSNMAALRPPLLPHTVAPSTAAAAAVAVAAAAALAAMSGHGSAAPAAAPLLTAEQMHEFAQAAFDAVVYRGSPSAIKVRA